MKALILSGGTGTRLRPLTYSNAKQLLPLANKPILVYLIEKIIKAGINEIGIIVGDTHEQVENEIGNGEKWGIKITYIYQKKSLGLAHAVQTASGFIGNSDFMMVLGDNVFNMELDVLIRNFYTKIANTTILLHKAKNASQFGVVVVQEDTITALVEKPKKFISDIIITGVYVFDHSIFTAIEKIKPSSRGELEITDAIQKQLETGGKITYEFIQGWWKDTGKIEDILEANRLMLDELENKGQDIAESNSYITGKVFTGKNVIVKDSIIQGPVHIDDDAVIINSCIGPYTAIGKRSRITECEIDNCLILSDAQFQNVQKRVSNSLIGKNVSIQSGVNKRPFVSTFFIGDNSQIYL